MKVTLSERLAVFDGSATAPERGRVVLPPGEYELIEIENPTGHPDPWLVVEGTFHGAAKAWWFSPDAGEQGVELEVRDESSGN